MRLITLYLIYCWTGILRNNLHQTCNSASCVFFYMWHHERSAICFAARVFPPGLLIMLS